MDIRGLLDDPGRISLVTQPIVDMKRGTVVGYEALARFELETRAAPDVVFAEAARQGLAVSLEALVVKRALELGQRKPNNCFLTFNVDPGNLLTRELRSVMNEPQSLAGMVIELTEHRAVEDMKALVGELESYRRRGALIAVDDAGSGYSGLRQLLELRPQIVKVDRDLVTNVHQDAAKYALIEMLGELAGRLDAWLLAEGIENEAELSVLRQLRVPLAQGYFLARPAPPWPLIAPQARHFLSASSLSEQRIEIVRRLLEPCATYVDTHDGSDHGLAVRLTAEGRPVGMRLGTGAETQLRQESELLRVKANSTLSVVAQRAVTRSERTRWDPIVCISESGQFRGIVRMHRLVSALAEGNPAASVDNAMH